MQDEEYRNSRSCFIWGRDHVNGGEKIIEPTLIPELEKKNIVQLSCGSIHTICLSDSGDLYSWGGSNSSGQLGHAGESKNQFIKPKNIKKFSLLKSLNGDSVIQLSTGLDFSIALTDQGSLYGWGSNVEGQLALGPPATLLNNTPPPSSTQTTNNTTTMNGINKNILTMVSNKNQFQVAAATSTSILLDSLTSAHSTRSYITLTNELKEQQHRHQQLQEEIINKKRSETASMNPFNSVSNYIKEKFSANTETIPTSSSSSNCNNTSNNNSSSSSSIGNNNPIYSSNYENKYKIMVPLKMMTFEFNGNGYEEFNGGGGLGEIKIQQISCGSNHILALSSNGQIYSWGANEYGKLGHGEDYQFVSSNPRWINTPKKIKSLEDKGIQIISISCGYSHCMILTKDSGIMTWGKGSDGQLGTGFRHDIWSPFEIKKVIHPNEKIVYISCGYFNSFFITLEKRELFQFGWSIPLGKSDDLLIPTKFNWPNSRHHHNHDDDDDYDEDEDENNRIKQVSSGYSHTLVLNENGECLSLGQGEFGQLGIPLDHSNLDKDCFLKEPTIIPKLLPYFVESIQCGRWHSIAIVSNKKLRNQLNLKKQKFEQEQEQQLKNSMNNLEILEEFESNIEEIERLINQTVVSGNSIGDSDNKNKRISLNVNNNNNNNSNSNRNSINEGNDIFESLSKSFQTYMEETKVTTNDEFEKSFFLLQQDYISSDNKRNEINSSSGSVNNGGSGIDDDDTSIKEDEIKITKSFYKDMSDFLFKSRSSSTSGSTSTSASGVSSSSSSLSNSSNSGPLLTSSILNSIEGYSLLDGYPEEQEELLVQVWLTRFLPDFDKLKENRREWRDLWRRGFSPSSRPFIWKRAIGNKLEISGTIYHGLLAQCQDLQSIYDSDLAKFGEGFEAELPPNLPKEYQSFIKTFNMIKVDLPRTFPQLRLFNSSGALHEQLRTTLILFALYTPNIGYVQGMSYLAAVICLYMDPFESFVCFTNLLNNHFFNSLFRMDVKEIIQHVKIFDLLFKSHLPKLYEKFQKLELNTEHFLLEWMMTLFTKQLPLNIVFRIWDCYLIEGETFIYKTAIGVLNLIRNFIDNKDSSFEDSLSIIKNAPQNLKEEDLFESITSVHVPKFIKKITNLVNKDFI